MGWALHRPTAFTVPGFALRLALGELGEDVLRSQRVLPRRLLASGYEFRHPDIESTLAAALQRRPPQRA
jgi:NAD dependent epimerase/dehydratase family enzyme